MEKYLTVLESCPLFDRIGREELLALLDCLGAGVMEVKRNHVIFAEGDPARHLGIVLSGCVQIEKLDFYGNRSIVTQAVAGELFAESFACAGAARMPVSAVATEDCHIMLVECSRITVGCSNACGFHSRLISNLLQIVARRNLQLNQKIEITAKRTTREKLMAYLLGQAKLQGSDSFQIPFDRQALADYLQVERSAMSAEISKLRKEGVLESTKNHFRLLHRQELAQY